MGTAYRARCKQCGKKFMVSEGGGFHFELLHCDNCGEKKGVPHEDMGDILPRHLKSLLLTKANESELRKDETARRLMSAPGTPLSDDQYAREISLLAGKCRCGGAFTLNAPARCPKCRSTDFEDTGEECVDYD
jgi:predicted Zn-ribbon and HTH transcriptional regulator